MQGGKGRIPIHVMVAVRALVKFGADTVVGQNPRVTTAVVWSTVVEMESVLITLVGAGSALHREIESLDRHPVVKVGEERLDTCRRGNYGFCRNFAGRLDVQEFVASRRGEEGRQYEYYFCRFHSHAPRS